MGSTRFGIINNADLMRHLKALGLAVAAVAIAIVAYYGFFYVAFPPYSTFWGNFCTFSAGIKCLSSSLLANGLVTVTLEQSLSPQISLTAMGCNRLGSATSLSAIIPPKEMMSGQNVTLSVSCYGSNTTIFNGAAGSTYSGYLVLNYTTASGNKFTIPGLLNLKVG